MEFGAVARPSGRAYHPHATPNHLMRDFDDNEFPLAYLITLRTYGTWLHGDERGSMDRKHNVYGTSKIAPNSRLNKSDTRQLKHPPGQYRLSVEGERRGEGD